MERRLNLMNEKEFLEKLGLPKREEDYDLLDFMETIEYPTHEQFLSGIQPGISYDYVSSTYLNGFINYVDILDAFMIHRYMNEKEFTESIERIKHKIKTREVHTNVQDSSEYDDILILGKIEDMYVYFWNDCDCSDCCIGAINKDVVENRDSKAITLFRRYADKLKKIDTAQDVFFIPLEFFTGWITL